MPHRFRLIAAAVLAFAVPLPAAAQDPLRSLVPLLEVFGGTGKIPGYDVAGIRCAGLFYAQDTWRQKHGGEGPSARMMTESATALEASVQERINNGASLTDATLSVEVDLRRVHGLYLARFQENAASGHPWRKDRLLKGDQTYCEIAFR